MSLQGSKSKVSSITIWGGVIAIAAPVARALGYEVSSADVSAVVDTVTTVIGAIGGLMAVVGRVRATRKIA